MAAPSGHQRYHQWQQQAAVGRAPTRVAPPPAMDSKSGAARREWEPGRPPPAAATGDSAGGRLVRPRLPAPTAFVGVSNRSASAATNSSKLAFGSISEFGFGAHQVGAMIHSA